MKCPVDGATLMMTERSGVEIDYCPQCRGVWLDRGELDKILARAQGPVALDEPSEAPRRDGHGETARDRRPARAHHGDDRRAYGDKLGEWHDRDEDHHRRTRRKGFLGDLFDF